LRELFHGIEGEAKTGSCMVMPLIMLSLLVLPYFLLQAVPRLRERPSLRGCLGLTLVFCFTGVGHFLTPELMAEMIPPAIPCRLEIICVSGVVEILAGLALLPTASRVRAGWFVIAMLVLLLPANVYAAMQRVPMGGHEWGPVYLLIRVPLQAVLVAWCYWFAVRKGSAGSRVFPG
jgi:uncharacterized membrane protein